jgi:hypothetical protein
MLVKIMSVHEGLIRLRDSHGNIGEKALKIMEVGLPNSVFYAQLLQWFFCKLHIHPNIQ